ncbi:shikimate dehydrogenase [Natranaerofaba carboxydovora]|uniref:shikimate dehydrogenase n=1 Tax=Natranaerofaba carboxydovora TaxID=2742683 RepID=UPI001F13461B|nr:shikimate dehydrogenase [Natranaerofaba carboxydovora]UMZ75316.1 Aminotransferase PigE [Natranaerofaba carboxydovora]
MDDFAFIIHPIKTEDFAKKFPVVQKLPKPILERLSSIVPPFKVSDITGVKSPHNEVKGSFVACPLSSNQIFRLPEEFVLNKIIKAGRLAEKRGAKIVGLGALTAVVGDGGITVSRNLDIPVTTGNSYTVASAIEGVKKASDHMGYDYKNARICIVGGGGSIGAVTAEYLAREARFLTIVGREEKRLNNVAQKILNKTGLAVGISKDVKNAVSGADIIITVTGSVESVIDGSELKPGAIVCDVARPRDVSWRVANLREDVLVIEGGVVEVPGDVDFNFNFGFPEGTAYACMAETMILALEGKYESFTLGRDLTIEQIDEMNHLANKHGFGLAGFRSFERALSNDEIENIKKNAEKERMKLKEA